MNQKEIDLAKGRVTEEDLYDKKQMKPLSSQQALNLGKGMKLRILCDDNVEIAEVEIENIEERLHESAKYWFVSFQDKTETYWQIDQSTSAEIVPYWEASVDSELPKR